MSFVLNPILPTAVLILLGILLIGAALLLKTKTLKIFGIIVAGLLVIVGLRPMVPDGESTAYHDNLDLIFVMDNTLSMLAEDYNGSSRRIDAVINDVQYITKQLPGTYYSLISFSNESTINLRSTTDTNAVATAVKTLHQTDAFYARGSTITIFKDDLAKLLQASVKKNERRRVVFIFTDGENTSEESLVSLSDLRQYIDDGAVLGYGTAQGGKMKVDEYGDGVYSYLEYYDENFYKTTAVSKIDETNLQKLATDLGVDYIHMQKSSDLDAKLADLLALRNLDEGGTELVYADLYYYFCWPLLGVLLAMLYLAKREYAL